VLPFPMSLLFSSEHVCTQVFSLVKTPVILDLYPF
jgi:hypothetical protein